MTQTQKKSRSKKKTQIERQKRILEAAQDIFAEKGFIKTTLSDIATHSDVPEASIYDLFSNKADILFRLAEQSFTELRKNLHIHFLGIDGVINRFRKFIWHYLHFFQENPEFCRVFVLEIMHNARFIESEACQAMAAHHQELTSILEEGIKSGEFAELINLDLCEIMVFGSMNYMMLSRIVLGQPLDFIQDAESLYSFFFRSITTESYPVMETISAETGKRKDILVAAMNEFVDKGFQQSTISQIAKRAGVTEPTIYEHFTSKEELLYNIPRSSMENGTLVKSIGANLANLNTPVNRLKFFITNHICTIGNHPAFHYLMVSELRRNIGFYKDTSYQFMKDYSLLLDQIIRDGKESGSFRNDIKAKYVINVFFGLIDKLIITLYVKKRLPEIKQLTEAVYDLIYNAIRSDLPDPQS